MYRSRERIEAHSPGAMKIAENSASAQGISYNEDLRSSEPTKTSCLGVEYRLKDALQEQQTGQDVLTTPPF